MVSSPPTVTTGRRAAHPAIVGRRSSESRRLLCGLFDRLVVHRVEDADDVALDSDRVRNGDFAGQQAADRLRDTVLPLPGGPKRNSEWRAAIAGPI